MVYVSNKLPPEEVRYQTEHIHENRGVGLVAFLIVALVASTVFVLARLYVRYRSRVKLEGADYTVIAALVFVYAQFICTFLQVPRGLGKHDIAISPADYAFLLKVFFPWGIFYDINVGLFKISILLLYRRVFAVRWLRITVDVNVAFITAFTIALVGKDVFACTPIRRQWTPDLPGSCIDLQATYYWASALFLLTDLIILILPQPLVWRLQISRRQKFGLTLIFCLGIIVTVATILRLVVVIRYNRLDFAYAFVPVVYWMGAESSLGIICACCATIRPLFQAKKSGVAHYSGYLRHTGSSVDRQSRAPATFTSSTTRQNSAQLGTSAKARSDDATLLDPDPEIAIPLGRIMIKKDIDVEGSRSEGSL